MYEYSNRDTVQELTRIAEEFQRERESLLLDIIHAAPSRVQDGTIVYADGTDWNPGAGEGFYGYENGAWVKL